MHLDDHVAVVTINWNGWQMTLDCLSSLRASRGASWRLYIVDNASTDGSVEKLRDLGSDVVLLELPVNGGWTGGNNLGIRRALQDGYSRIFILNNDALVEPDTMAQLLSFSLSRVQPPIIGPLHSNMEGSRLDFIGSGYDAATGLPTYESRTVWMYPIFLSTTPPSSLKALECLSRGTILNGSAFSTNGII